MSPPPHAKIAHLTSVHFPFDTRIFHRQCKTLRSAGYDVVLIAPHERSEEFDGVRLNGVPVPKNRWMRMTNTVLAVLRAALAEKADLYHFHDPELIPVGMWLRAAGKRVIYDVHEDYPRQIASKPWIMPWLRGPVSGAVTVGEVAVAQVINGIAAATPEIGRRFPKKKTAIVQNFPVLEELEPQEAISYCDRPLEIAYVGVIADVRGAKEMVRALGRLPHDSGACLVLAGNFRPSDLQEDLERLPGWSKVVFLGWQSRPEVAALLSRARIGLVVLHPLVNYLDSYPVKLFEYMSVGLPVIASDFPIWRQIVESAGCGLLVDPLDPTAIADGIQWLLDHPEKAEEMGRKGREAVTGMYNWENELKKLLMLYDTVLR